MTQRSMSRGRAELFSGGACVQLSFYRVLRFPGMPTDWVVEEVKIGGPRLFVLWRQLVLVDEQEGRAHTSSDTSRSSPILIVRLDPIG